MIQTDKNSNAFGLTKDSLDTKPMCIQAHLLPQAKIQYANKVLDPELKGEALANATLVIYHLTLSINLR